MFIVFDNKRRAQGFDCKVSTTWRQCVFATFEEAREYADKWLGTMGPCTLTNCGIQLYGFGSHIEIRYMPYEIAREEFRVFADILGITLTQRQRATLASGKLTW